MKNSLDSSLVEFFSSRLHAFTSNLVGLGLVSILPERQIQPALEPETARRAAGHDATDAVVTQPCGSAEDEGVAGLEQDRLQRIAGAKAAEQKPRRAADR